MQGAPSTLAPAGQGAHLIAPLAWLLIVVAAAVCLIVAALVIAGARRRGTIAEHAPPDAGGGTGWIQMGGLLVPILVLAATFLPSERTLRALRAPPHAATGGCQGAAPRGPRPARPARSLWAARSLGPPPGRPPAACPVVRAGIAAC